MLGAKKPVFCTEQFFSQRRRIVSGFGLCVAASIIVLSLLLLNQSLKTPKSQTFLQGFLSSAANSSFTSRAFLFSTANSSSSKIGSNGIVSLHRIGDGDVLKRTDNRNGTAIDVHGNSPVRNPIPKDVNGSFQAVEERVQQKTLADEGNSLKHSSETNGNLVPLRLRAEIAHAEKILGKEPWENGSFSYSINETAKNISTPQFLNNATSRRVSVGSESSDEWPRGVLIKEKDENFSDSQHTERKDGSYKDCDIFDGKWVRDDSKPYYPAGSCPYIDKDFDCHLNGRPDSQYVKWKWKPNGCDIPSLNATDFLERLKGKRLVFVGDSLNRNMWESLVCILRQSVRHKKRVYEISGRSDFKKKGVYAFRFEDYNTSIDFVGAPFLVQESVFKSTNGSMETLRLDLMDVTTKMYHDADVIVFNTGHWWTHEKTSRGEDYYQEGNYIHPRLKVLEAYKRALTTWAKWVDRHIDHNRTQVFFRGYSVTHFSGGQWNSGGQCHKEIEPIYNETYLEKYPSKMRTLEYVVQKMKTPVTYLNISRLTDYRKDGHPSIYRMQYKTEAERTAAERYQDCSHWCLPGVPDTWNELLYVSLLKSGHESWKN